MKTKFNDFMNENKDVDGIHTTTAIFNGDYYEHFGIQPFTASLYGNDPDEIVEIKFHISDDQQVYEENFDGINDKADYWGWYEPNKGFSMIYPKRFLLNMCFPAGIEGTENAHPGSKAYRLEIIKINNN